MKFRVETYPDERTRLWQIDVRILDDRRELGFLDASQTTVQALAQDAAEAGRLAAAGEEERIFTLTFAEQAELIGACIDDLREVGDLVGEHLAPFIVHHVGLEEELQGRGYGIAMYRAAARAAARKGGALVAQHCLLRGETSAEAYRVWESERLAQDYTVIGNVVYGGPPTR